MGMRKELIGWNIAVDENISSDDIKFELQDKGGYVWEEPKVKLTIPACKYYSILR